MTITITEEERKNFRNVPLKNLGHYFKIPNWDIKPNEELYDELMQIQNKSVKTIMKLLIDYFNAYDNWFNFLQKRKKNKKEPINDYAMSIEEQEKLEILIVKIKESKIILQEKFDELQVSNFNKNIFGEDILGIIKNE